MFNNLYDKEKCCINLINFSLHQELNLRTRLIKIQGYGDIQFPVRGIDKESITLWLSWVKSSIK